MLESDMNMLWTMQLIWEQCKDCKITKFNMLVSNDEMSKKEKIWRQDKRETYEQWRRIKSIEQQRTLTTIRKSRLTCKKTKK
jgi:hypothetical protein